MGLRNWLQFAAGTAPKPQPLDTPAVTWAQFQQMLESGAGGVVTRDEALQVPTVVAARNRLVASVTGMPLVCYGPDNKPTGRTFLTKLDPNRTPSAIIADTVEDLFLEDVAYWLVTARDFDQFPSAVEHLSTDRVSVINEKFWVDGVEAEDRDVIQFEGLAVGILRGVSTAIRDSINLSKAAARFTASPMPLGYFTAAEQGLDPSNAQILEFLSGWEAARRAGAWGYVPTEFRLESPGLDPESLQLAESRIRSDIDIARGSGVDQAAVGVPSVSQVYQNIQQARLAELDTFVQLYARPIAERLSMDSVTPQGHRVVFDSSTFLASDTTTRYANYNAALNGANPWLTVDEVRALEKLPPLTATPASGTAAEQEDTP